MNYKLFQKDQFQNDKDIKRKLTLALQFLMVKVQSWGANGGRQVFPLQMGLCLTPLSQVKVIDSDLELYRMASLCIDTSLDLTTTRGLQGKKRSLEVLGLKGEMTAIDYLTLFQDQSCIEGSSTRDAKVVQRIGQKVNPAEVFQVALCSNHSRPEFRHVLSPILAENILGNR